MTRQLPRKWPDGALAGSIAAWPAAWIMTRLDKTEDDAQAARVARAVMAPLIGRSLDEDELKSAIPVVRYSIGTAVGAAYGSFVEIAPPGLLAAGLFGSAVWLLEVLLSADTRATVRGLAAHMAFGVMMEATRRAVRPLV